jgi:fatty-acyl-CoA synthase
MIRSTMQKVPLSLNQILERAGRLYPQSEIVSRLPDKSLKRHTFGEFYARARRLAAALLALGLNKGDRVATLSWNHYAHLECYFGIPAAGGVMHTLNLRLAPDDIAYVANHAQDRFVIVDDVLLPLLAQFRAKVPFEKIIVVPLAGQPVAAPCSITKKYSRPRRKNSTTSRTRKMTRSPCATPRARPGGPRASSIRTARP